MTDHLLLVACTKGRGPFLARIGLSSAGCFNTSCGVSIQLTAFNVCRADGRIDERNLKRNLSRAKNTNLGRISSCTTSAVASRDYVKRVAAG